MTGPIQPFRRPRRVHASRHEGDCYRYAVREVLAYLDAGSPDPAMLVVHGLVDSEPLTGYGHAWIERGGVAYDWQTYALRRPGASMPQPRPVEEYRHVHNARRLTIYTPTEVVRLALTGHYGPWDDVYLAHGGA